MDLKLWSQNKGPVSSLEIFFIATAKERSSSSKQDKSTVHRFFLFVEDSVVHHEFAWAGQTVNMEYYIQFCGIYKMQYTASDQRCDHQGTGKSTTTQLSQLVQHFLTTRKIPQVQKSLYSPHLALCVFLLYFPIQNSICKGEDLMMWNSYNKIWQSSFYRHQKQTSTIVLSNGKTAGISTSNHRGISLPLW